MFKIIIVDLPKPNGKIKGWWYNGWPVFKGDSEDSLNYAMLYAQEKGLKPDQNKLKQEHKNFIKTLESAGFKLHILPFPDELNKQDNMHHDAVFIRDSGLMFGNYWIKARFNARARQKEADIHTKIIAKKFNKQVLELPKGAYLEGGEIFYIKTKDSSYYFGGLSRSNKAGHDFAKKIIKPDHYCLIKSEGYHLDTVFSPVISKDNELVAMLVVKNMLSPESLKNLEKLNKKIIYLDPIDSSGKDDWLGNYAVNTLIAPGIMANCAKFLTPGVEEKLEQLGIKRFISPLSYFKYSGGSFHCLTNEVYN